MNAAAVQLLVDKGLTAQDIADLFAALERKVDRTGAERQARYRDRRDVSPEVWAVLRAEVFERDGYVCTYCGSGDALACDHIVPLVQGGKSTLDNLTTACRSCNCGKGGQTPEEWLGDGA